LRKKAEPGPAAFGSLKSAAAHNHNPQVYLTPACILRKTQCVGELLESVFLEDDPPAQCPPVAVDASMKLHASSRKAE
jgi:hypothetical protein